MSMLAERKVKQKYSINPRGLTWANDESKFGQKLMEKMGWSKGKGLGANESGDVDFVKVSLKMDKKGVGCSHQTANNWIAHQDDFTSILADLGSEHGKESNDKELTNGKGRKEMSTKDDGNQLVDLEEKSKNSSHRVHYQKFMKSKNLSTKEQKDLDCIFGRRDEKGYIIKSASSNNLEGLDELRNVDDKNKEPEGSIATPSSSASQSEQSDFQFGVHTITRTSSIADYFAQKMAQMRKSRSCVEFQEHCSVDDDGSNKLDGAVSIKKNKLDDDEEDEDKNDVDGAGVYTAGDNNNNKVEAGSNNDDADGDGIVKKKKNKNRKIKNNRSDDVSEADKKTKKRKRDNDDGDNDHDDKEGDDGVERVKFTINVGDGGGDAEPKKKKKNKKDDVGDDNDETAATMMIMKEGGNNAKKDKKKRKMKVNDEIVEEEGVMVGETMMMVSGVGRVERNREKSTKKSKKRKSANEDNKDDGGGNDNDVDGGDNNLKNEDVLGVASETSTMPTSSSSTNKKNKRNKYKTGNHNNNNNNNEHNNNNDDNENNTSNNNVDNVDVTLNSIKKKKKKKV